MKHVPMNKKKRGRPAGKGLFDISVQLRLNHEQAARIDQWILDQVTPCPSRSEAIRRLVEMALSRPSAAETIAKAQKAAGQPVQESKARNVAARAETSSLRSGRQSGCTELPTNEQD